MSALLVIFVLAVVVLVLQLGQQQRSLADQQERFSEQVSTLQQAEVIRSEMLLEIQADLKAAGIDVLVSENNSVISIPSELLGFEAASYDIEDEYQDVSLAIGTAVARAIEKDNRYKYLDTVFVEGHTDNVHFAGLEGAGNWGLSTFRAISLWTLWEDQLSRADQLARLRSADGSLLFSVSGYGETRPVNEKQSDSTNRAANRRIDLRFTIVRPSSQDLVEIEEQFSQRAEK